MSRRYLVVSAATTANALPSRSSFRHLGESTGYLFLDHGLELIYLEAELLKGDCSGFLLLDLISLFDIMLVANLF